MYQDIQIHSKRYVLNQNDLQSWIERVVIKMIGLNLVAENMEHGHVLVPRTSLREQSCSYSRNIYVLIVQVYYKVYLHVLIPIPCSATPGFKNKTEC